MRRLEAWPTRAQLRRGELLELEIHSSGAFPLQLRVWDGTALIAETEVRIAQGGVTRATVSLPDSLAASVGYGIELIGADEREATRTTTAIDVTRSEQGSPQA